MIDVPLYTKDGQATGTVPVDETLFGSRVRRRLLREIAAWYEANRRVGTHSTKTRAEVEGSTRKPWKQKHTGRARAGTVRSPIWRGGGVVCGPKPREYRVHIPTGMRHRALNSALLSKFADREAAVIETFQFDKPSTRRMSALLKAMGVDRSCLIGVEGYRREVWLSARNLPRIAMASVTDLNAYDVLKNCRLILTREALDRLLEERGGHRPAPSRGPAEPGDRKTGPDPHQPSAPARSST
jgi:large subunit ribosomal protein L4